MQSHRIELSLDSPVIPAPAPRIGSVQALGLSDVLRTELQPCQLAGLLDELDELRKPLLESFGAARRAYEELVSLYNGESLGTVNAAESNLESAAYSLRILAAMRSAIPSTTPRDPFALVGPATMVSSLIEGATRNVVDSTAELLRSSKLPNFETDRKLRELAIAAQAWIETYIDCRAIEMYSFDPDYHAPPGL
jgi:hypothetical protein